ncbi:chondroitin proteoglycan 2-like [Melitaea cinxia]|uniref:chondroitin proteoglycan 2-like n=1 Tax=Melitaea cinxia TaxID=113334 RepID=UPI001E27296D|nr:chondroitin proteoglycan 2-like [Melitaea cinxia]
MKVAIILLVSTLCLTNGKNIEVNDDPGQAKWICAEPKSDGVLVAHENCNQFYKCSQGEPVALNCPDDLLYNPDKEYCDWPQSVNCDGRIMPEADDSDSGNDNGPVNESTPDEAPAICAKPESDGVLIPHKNCNQFYKCSQGEPVALNCPGDLLYNPDKEYCDWPKSVQCGDRIIPDADDSDSGNDNGPDNETRPDEAPEICAKPESDGVLVPHENCNQFYKCSEGKPVALDCPENLLYNPLKEYCDWPKNVDCGNRID